MRAALALLTLALTLAALVPAVPAALAGDGFFNIRASSPTGPNDDPIVYPGQEGAAHLHEFLANETTAFDSTFRSMTRARTTCALSKDTSGYWIPALLDGNGDPAPVRKVLMLPRQVRCEGARVPREPADHREERHDEPAGAEPISALALLGVRRHQPVRGVAAGLLGDRREGHGPHPLPGLLGR